MFAIIANMGYAIFTIAALVAGLVLRGVCLLVRRGKATRHESDISGAVAARMMLAGHGIGETAIHGDAREGDERFDLRANAVHLSQSVYYGRNAAALAVACHECGHAVQHANGSMMLALRDRVNPVAGFCAKVWLAVMAAGLVSGVKAACIAAVCLWGAAMALQAIILPSELAASRYALTFLGGGASASRPLLDNAGLKGAANVLHAAALTYLTAHLAGLTEPIVRYVASFAGR